MRFIALDTETGGLDPQRNFPISLGVALFDGGELEDSQQWIISPPVRNGKITREYDINALAVSGIKWTDILRGDPANQVCGELTEWATERGARDLPVMAFNAPFDLSFYSELCFAAGSWNQATRSFESFTPPLYGPWQCVRMLAMERVKLASYSLDSVSAHFGLGREGEAHGALEDAILAGKVYEALEQLEAARPKAEEGAA